MSHGSFVIDTESGRVLAAELTAGALPPSFSVTIAVRYREDRQIRLLVPIKMQERHWQSHTPKDDRLIVTSSYSNFRRFQVIVDQQIREPKQSRSPPSSPEEDDHCLRRRLDVWTRLGLRLDVSSLLDFVVGAAISVTVMAGMFVVEWWIGAIRLEGAVIPELVGGAIHR